MAKHAIVLPDGQSTPYFIDGDKAYKHFVTAMMQRYHELTNTASARDVGIRCTVVTRKYNCPDQSFWSGQPIVMISEVGNPDGGCRIFLVNLNSDVVEWVGGVR